MLSSFGCDAESKIEKESFVVRYEIEARTMSILLISALTSFITGILNVPRFQVYFIEKLVAKIDETVLAVGILSVAFFSTFFLTQST